MVPLLACLLSIFIIPSNGFRLPSLQSHSSSLPSPLPTTTPGRVSLVSRPPPRPAFSHHLSEGPVGSSTSSDFPSTGRWSARLLSQTPLSRLASTASSTPADNTSSEAPPPPPAPNSAEFASACNDFRKSVQQHLRKHPEEEPAWINALTFNPMAPSGPMEVNNREEVWLPQSRRPRRYRKSLAIRKMVEEHTVRMSQLIYPLFVHEKENDEDIEAMEGCKRWSVNGLIEEVRQAVEVGVNSFMIFPKIEMNLKDTYGYEACNPYGLIPRVIRILKAAFPQITVCSDIALDPYTPSGHDGVLLDGRVHNDITVQQVCRQAIVHSEAGVDIVCPSEMMDGRVGALRDSMDAEGFTDVSIMAYTCKFASSLFSPFRDALKSAPAAAAGDAGSGSRVAEVGGTSGISKKNVSDELRQQSRGVHGSRARRR
eukprot:GHVS01049510.1.p1 GENE.GHVS01049510.1~~GHVS01049510.1.p1  ORF type:complete len:439 (+),score=49.53 GHVS01049510.1:38-1318(+)